MEAVQGLAGPEILITGSLPEFYGSGERTWTAMEWDPSAQEYRFGQHSDFPEADIALLGLAQADGVGPKEIVVLLENGRVEIRDAATKSLISSWQSALVQAKSFAAGDRTGDGLDEIYVSGTNGLVEHMSDGTLLRTWLGATRGYGGSYVSIGQVDGDSSLEIVCHGGLLLDAATGAIQWSLGRPWGYNIRCGDIDGDGLDEIVSAGFNQDGIYAWDANLQAQKWLYPISGVPWICLFDENSDGRDEVLITMKPGMFPEYRIGVLDGVTGTLARSMVTSLKGDRAFLVADPDQDQEFELITGADSILSSGINHIEVRKLSSGTLEWFGDLLGAPFQSACLAILEPGALPLLYSAVSNHNDSNGRILVLDPDRLTRLGLSGPVGPGGYQVWLNSMIQHDLDLDGDDELITAAEERDAGSIQVWDHASGFDLNLLWSSPARTERDTIELLAAGDVDADGKVEIVAASAWNSTAGTGVYIYTFEFGSTAPEWTSPPLGSQGQDPLALTVSNLDADPALEICVLLESGIVHAFDGSTHQLQHNWVGPFTAMAAVPGTDMLLMGDANGRVGLQRPNGFGGLITLRTGRPAPELVDEINVVELSAGFRVGVSQGGIYRLLKVDLASITHEFGPHGRDAGTRPAVHPTRDWIYLPAAAALFKYRY